SIAFSGGKTPFQLLRSRLGVPKRPAGTGKILAVDFGGTNIRLAEVSFDENGRLVMGDHTQEKAISGIISSGVFFGWLAGEIARYDTADVGLVFSYRASILPGGDARIVGFSKGLSVPDAVGLVIGEEINKVLVSRGLSPRRFFILNDTTAVFLTAASELAEPEKLAAAVIAGTGSNCCCVRDGEIINTEWVRFSEFPQGRFDLIIDENSENRGQHLTGKLVGGKYLAMLVDMCLEAALEAGVEEDAEAARKIIYDLIYRRSAIYVTAMLRGIVGLSPALELARSGEGPAGIWIAIEGGTYDKAPGYKEYLNDLIRRYISVPLRVGINVIQADRAVITGAAIAALRPPAFRAAP
ncbi:MAG: hypothetical protein II689_03240, partial [Firmicutes bacterium]|nr:hypothetical protein [Bacillota bacterium]